MLKVNTKLNITGILNFSVIVSFLLVICIKAQDLPQYPERTLQQPTSLQETSETESIFTGISEGSINPDEYYVGPGDKIFISITGVKQLTYYIFIDQEGWMYVPQVGGIDLNDLTLAEAKSKLEESINKYYKDVKIFISLVGIRKIRVSLIGDVVKPSSLVISADSRLLDLITASNGLNETANIRTIEVKSKKGIINHYDLLKFLRFGDFNQNPFLREGDVVFVDKSDKIVSIAGLVKYPGSYEYVEGETANDLIRLSGGYLSTAKTDTIELVRFNEIGTVQKSYYYSTDYLAHTDVVLQNKDRIIVRELPEYLIEYYVQIDGYVKYPGYYKIEKDKTTLKDIIKEAGGFLDRASLVEATLTRKIDNERVDPEFERLKTVPRADMSDEEYDYFKAKSRERSGRVVVDFVKLFRENDEAENVVLKKGDFIRIPESKNYVTMLGQLVNPGNIIYDSTLTVDDYIRLAGGFGWRAEDGEVRVIRARTGEWIYADEVDHLERGDAIWVPEEPPPTKFWDIFTTTLQVLGQVAAVVAATVAVIVAAR